jgi:hypothetical protein
VRPAVLLAVSLAVSLSAAVKATADDYLTWSSDRAATVAKSTRVKDSAGQSWWDTRGRRTERSMKYDVVATWMTPEVIQASARIFQIRDGLSAEATKALVAEADKPGQTVVMIEIDPHEGSGVVPLDWQAYLLPFTGAKGIDGAVSGVGTPALRDVKALAGIVRRDYAYDRFWMVFPLKSGGRQAALRTDGHARGNRRSHPRQGSADEVADSRGAPGGVQLIPSGV